jgi:circadian clock protein KaiC
LSTQEKIKENKLLTGVPVLDEIVGGGLPTFSFNIIARAPGSGKKTQARQIVFANAFSALDFEVPSQRFEWRAD